MLVAQPEASETKHVAQELFSVEGAEEQFKDGAPQRRKSMVDRARWRMRTRQKIHSHMGSEKDPDNDIDDSADGGDQQQDANNPMAAIMKEMTGSKPSVNRDKLQNQAMMAMAQGQHETLKMLMGAHESMTGATGSTLESTGAVNGINGFGSGERIGVSEFVIEKSVKGEQAKQTVASFKSDWLERNIAKLEGRGANSDQPMHIPKTGKSFLLTVCAGHGVDAEKCASFVERELEDQLFQQLLLKGSTGATDSALQNTVQGMRKAYEHTHLGLSVERGVDHRSSGTAATLVLSTGRELVVACVGDTKAVLGLRKRPRAGTRQLPGIGGAVDGAEVLGCAFPVPITRDHTLEVKSERERVQAAGGVIASAAAIRKLAVEIGGGMRRFVRETEEDEPSANSADGVSVTVTGRSTDLQVDRVWEPNSGSMEEGGECTPGLHLTRTIGDSLAHGLGVSAEPEVYCHPLNHSETVECPVSFLIIGSSSLWEAIRTEEAVAMVAVDLRHGSGASGAAKRLLKKAQAHFNYGKSRSVGCMTCAVVLFAPQQEEGGVGLESEAEAAAAAAGPGMPGMSLMD
jgi:serine/threonine protein phosphatase PrpC